MLLFILALAAVVIIGLGFYIHSTGSASVKLDLNTVVKTAETDVAAAVKTVETDVEGNQVTTTTVVAGPATTTTEVTPKS